MRPPQTLMRERLALRKQLGPIAADISDTALRMLHKTGDVDLAYTALTMVPRPAWVTAIAGPLEPAKR